MSLRRFLSNFLSGTAVSDTSPPPPLSPDAETSASVLSHLLFTWVYPLIRRGSVVPLELSDLPHIHSSDSAQQLGPFFHYVYRHIVARDESTQPPPNDEFSLSRFHSAVLRLMCAVPPFVSSRTWRALLVVCAVPFFRGAAMRPLWLIFAISRAFSIRFIIILLSTTISPTPSSSWVTLPLAFTLAIASILMSISSHAVFYNSSRAAMSARAALSHHIFRTILQLPPHAYTSLTAKGTLGNLLVTDMQRIVDAFQYFHFCWFGFIELSVISAILFIDLGLAALVGFGCLAILIPIQITLARIVARARTHVTISADARVQTMHNLLSAIRLVKYSAWESHFYPIVHRLRAVEFAKLRTVAIVRGANTALFYAAPLFISLASFAAYTLLLRRRLSAEIAFTTVSFYSIITMVLSLLPIGWLTSTEASVSTSRLDKFFNLAESYAHLRPCNAMVSTRLPLHHNPSSQSSSSETTPMSNNNDPLNSTCVGKVIISDASFSHTGAGPVPQDRSDREHDDGERVEVALRDVSLSAFANELVCVVGAVGCGKSTLLNGILGEIHVVKGSVELYGRIAYCGQVPWIVNGTLRYNITMFGLHSQKSSLHVPSSSSDTQNGFAKGDLDNESWYATVVKACALDVDIAALPAKDETEIGERGVNLSGGQKARIALARAVYSRADVFILDDPLSAVDAAVASHIVRNVLGSGGLLAEKVRIVATHHVSLLPLASRIVVLERGIVADIGTYDELCAKGIKFYELVPVDDSNNETSKSHGGGSSVFTKEVNAMDPLCMSRQVANASEEHGLSPSEDVASQNGNGQCTEQSVPCAAPDIDGGKLVKEEDRKTGHVSRYVFAAYVNAGGGWFKMILVLFIFVVAQAARVVSEVWVGLWTSEMSPGVDVNSAAFRQENFKFVWQLLVLSLGTLVLLLFRAGLFAHFTMLASKRLHDGLVKRVLHATMAFFDTNPTGRILNRFSKDVDQMDMALPLSMQDVLQIAFLVLGAVVTIAWILPWFLLAMVPVVGVFFYFQVEYKKSSRELKRLDGIAFSPIYSMVVESLSGSTTIRAFASESVFMERFDWLVNQHLSAYHVFQSSGRWLGVRLDAVSAIVLFAVAFVVVVMGKRENVGLVGVALTSGLLMTGVFQFGVRQAAETENLFTSVERVVTMSTETPVERLYESGGEFPKMEEWPNEGVVEFESVKLQYRPGLPLALKGVTFATRAGERIGVVGRTGSGKTSLLVALFRMVELYGGVIRVDGRDVAEVGLKELRGRMAIVPQDAMLFDGTVRVNLDPTGRWSDVELWEALGRVYMREKVGEMGQEDTNGDGGCGLDATIRDNGANLSVGERQLLCLARVILSGVRVVVLDEASASLDNETDELVQEAVKRELGGRTVITIAHRIATVMDCDRVVVVDKGTVAEFGPPQQLMRQGGHFASLVQNGSAGHGAQGSQPYGS